MVFLCLLAALMLLERWRPRRPQPVARGRDDLRNILLGGISAIAAVLATPILWALTIITINSRDWGLFSWFALPPWLEVVACIILLDMAIYWQHRFFHWQPMLWKVHRVHHTDVSLGATTGVRFHPIEIFLSVLIKTAVIILLGAPALAVLIFEILLNASSLFEHSNLRLPASVDKKLRTVIVTPDMHRVHHSIYRHETDSNFGFCLSIWDRLFSSYIAQPRDDHLHMQIGQPQFPQAQGLAALLLQPFYAPQSTAYDASPSPNPEPPDNNHA